MLPAESEASLCSPAPASHRATLPTPLKLGILASGSGSNFEAVAQAIAQQRLPAQIKVLIYNNPEATVLQRAERYGTPTQLLNHRDYPSREALDQAIVEVLHGYGVELVVMVGWMRVITPVLLDAFPKVLNIHPSLLPSFKGIRAVEQAIAAGVKIAGCTVHWVVPEVDSGKILVQAAVPVLPNDTPTSLHARIQVQEHRIIVEAIAQVAEQVAGQVAEQVAEHRAELENISLSPNPYET
jgi:phosphoribosylglycinamide formyltransferase 1